MIYKGIRKSPEDASQGLSLAVSLSSGVIAGVAAAIISHPADTLLSKINKAGAGGTGSTVSRLVCCFVFCLVGLQSNHRQTLHARWALFVCA